MLRMGLGAIEKVMYLTGVPHISKCMNSHWRNICTLAERHNVVFSAIIKEGSGRSTFVWVLCSEKWRKLYIV
jgi:hypothetical protein